MFVWDDFFLVYIGYCRYFSEFFSRIFFVDKGTFLICSSWRTAL